MQALLARLTMLLAAFSLLTTATARADSEGYLDNWNGDLRIEVKALLNGFQTIVLPLAPEPLSTTFNNAWTQKPELRAMVCHDVGDMIAGLGTRFSLVSCEAAAKGELRARFVSPNELDLKYVVPGNRFRLRVHANIPLVPDPEGEGLFDIELRATLTFDNTIDGRILPEEAEQKSDLVIEDENSPYLVKPTHFFGPRKKAPATGFELLPTATSANVQLTSKSFIESALKFLGQDPLPRLEAAFNGKSQQLDPDLVKSNFSVAEQNRMLHLGAKEVATLIKTQHPELGTPTPLFDLAVFMDNRTFVIQYNRSGNPPQKLPGCTCNEMCGEQVSCQCAAAALIQPNDHVFLQRFFHADWVTVGMSSTNLVTGDALGARTGDVLRHRICRANKFGSSCTDPFDFTYTDRGACGPPGGGPPPSTANHCGSFFDPKPCIGVKIQ